MTIKNMGYEDLRKIEAKLGEALWLPFTKEYLIMNGEENASFFWSDSMEETKRVFEIILRNEYDIKRGAHIVTMKRYPRFAESVGAAMQIMDRLHALEICWTRMEYKSAIFADDWNRMGWEVLLRSSIGRIGNNAYVGSATSLPMAICEATLKIYEAGWLIEVKQ